MDCDSPQSINSVHRRSGLRTPLRECVFCGKDKSAGPMSSEHLAPKCLWVTKPLHFQVVPAHRSCNSAYSADNEYFRDVLAMEEHDFEHSELAKVRRITMRSKIDKYIGSLAKSFATAAVRSIYTPSGIYLGEEPTCVVDRQKIDRVLTNITKSLYYLRKRRRLSESTAIAIYWPKESKAAEIQPALSYLRQQPWWNFGDDVFGIKWLFHPTEPEAMVCLMQFYRSRTYLGMTLPVGVRPLFA